MEARTLEVPDPPFPSGAPYWYWLGGRLATDFANTRRERWRRDVECLVTPEDVGEWLLRARLLPASMAVARPVLEEARALREAIDAGIRAAVAGSLPPAAAVRLVDGWLVHAGGRPALVLDDEGVRLAERGPADSPRRALGMVALDAAHMLGLADERARVRICAAEDCSARFYDRSPAGVRRWCDMRRCGNVAKARRHRDRRRAASR
jgi:predicted RNA-binding Zn ribbon-like protein